MFCTLIRWTSFRNGLECLSSLAVLFLIGNEYFNVGSFCVILQGQQLQRGGVFSGLVFVILCCHPPYISCCPTQLFYISYFTCCHFFFFIDII
uniref:Uncharacterized protein n=1 Tax=Octopus bimaculoides TaxID=37653 RepID=A0A0L8HZS9_OCTBM